MVWNGFFGFCVFYVTNYVYLYTIFPKCALHYENIGVLPPLTQIYKF